MGDGKIDNIINEDDLYIKACAIVINSQNASVSNLQRKLVIGYNRAARLIEAMESQNIVSIADNTGVRKVLKK